MANTRFRFTKAAVKRALGFRTDQELADFFGCTRAGVGLWKGNKELPKHRIKHLQDARPDLFAVTP